YLVERFEAGQKTELTEQYSIRRPFDAQITGLTGAPPGQSTEWLAKTVLGRYSYSPSDGQTEVGRATPRSAAGDVRLDATLDDLVTSGKFVARERRKVLGYECQVYRTGLGVESFQVEAPTDTDYADTCIDANGLMLEQVTLVGGVVSQRRIVTEIDAAATLADDRFEITGDDTPLADGGTELRDIDKATLPVTGYWQLSPDGYEHVARYRVLQPGKSSSTDTSTTSTTVPPPQETYADVYSKGADYIVVQQGPKAAAPDAATDTEAVTVGDLGGGQLQVAIAGSSVQTFPSAPADWFVTVTGSLSKAELVEIASTAKS
ncbi:MAG TPA: hypothetical protein VF855_03090, partial [Acidimicrobiales bacterium]